MGKKKRILFWGIFFLMGLFLGSEAFAWTAAPIAKPGGYPKKPIDFICGWGVGGGADLMSRKVGELTDKYYGIKMVVSNMPGAGGAKAVDYAMRQPADGYTIFFGAWDAYMNYILGKSEFGPDQIEMIFRGQYVPGAYWVRKDSSFKTWKEVVEYSKKNPFKLKVADVGKGGLGDFTLALWEKCTGLKITYMPFDKPAQRYSAFAGGHTDLLYEQPGDIPALIEQGARPLVFMSDKRQKDFPDTPTSKELGCDVTIALWRGIAINKKTPQNIQDYLSKVLASIAKSPDYEKFLALTKADPKSVLTGKAANQFYVQEAEMVKKIREELQKKK
jgi:tripartite-type tricarboxylate transporter receptor subunit TctC